MKKSTVLAALFVALVSYNVKGQATNSTIGIRNGTIPSTSQNGLSGTSGKNRSGATGNSAPIRGKSSNHSTGSSTVDGSTNGSATNDGASGQSGSPIANQSAAIDQSLSQQKTNTDRRMKKSYRKMSHGRSVKTTKN